VPRTQRLIQKRCIEVKCGKPFQVESWNATRLARCPDCRDTHRAAAAICVVCEESFPRTPSSNHVRCPNCVKNGRGRCAACGDETAVRPGVQGVTLCPSCLEGKTPAEKLLGDYVRIVCRGDSAFGGTAHAKRCLGVRIWTRTRALSRLSTFNPVDLTYICDRCHGLVIQRLGAVTRRERQPRETEIRQQIRHGEFVDVAVSVAPPRLDSRKAVHDVILSEAQASGRWIPGDATRLPSPKKHPSVSSRAAWRRVAGFWRAVGGPAIVIDECPWCRRLTFNAKADTDRGRGRFHRPCWEAALQSEKGRAWQSARLRLMRSPENAKRTAPQRKALADKLYGDEPPVPSRHGPVAKPRVLTRNFGCAVRHLLGGDTLGALAAEYGLTPQGISNGIRSVLDSLPESDAASPRFAKYIVALREAASSR
jgi:hypothetical protein